MAPSCSGHRDGLTVDRGERWTKKNGGKGKEEMSSDSIKTHQTSPALLLPSLSVFHSRVFYWLSTSKHLTRVKSRDSYESLSTKLTFGEHLFKTGMWSRFHPFLFRYQTPRTIQIEQLKGIIKWFSKMSQGNTIALLLCPLDQIAGMPQGYDLTPFLFFCFFTKRQHT